MRTKSANFFLSGCDGDISASDFLPSSTAITSSRSQADCDEARSSQGYAKSHHVAKIHAAERILPRHHSQAKAHIPDSLDARLDNLATADRSRRRTGRSEANGGDEDQA